MDVHLPLNAEPECINNDISQLSDSKTEVQTQIYDSFFVCQLCNSGFSEKGVFRKHQHTHSCKYYFCEVCHSRLSEKYYLKNIFSYYIKNLHICETCQQTFSEKFLFNHHHIIYSKENPCSCEMCY